MDKKYIILVAVIILLAGFILYDVGGEIIQNQNQFSYSSGAEAAVFAILNTASTCPERGVEIDYQNQTFRLHWEGCLNAR